MYQKHMLQCAGGIKASRRNKRLKSKKHNMSEKVTSKKKQKRESLLRQSFQLFTEKGFQNTSISDIAKNAGVAKGTFYLYFKDKYDLRNRLTIHEASKLFFNAYNAFINENAPDSDEGIVSADVEEIIVFMMEHILDELASNKPLLVFLNKNLSWGVFRNAFHGVPKEDEPDFNSLYRNILEKSPVKYRDPEIALFLIVELVGSAGYSSIIYGDPLDLEHLKPYLKREIHNILKSHERN